jgi:hypothetical protein
MDSLVGLVAIVMVFGIPMSAIIGSFWLKAKRLQLASGEGAGTASRLAKLEADNQDLRQRVEVLETIVTSDTSTARQRVLLEPTPDRALAAMGAAEQELEAKARTTTP